MEVIHSVIPVVSSEDVDPSSVHNSSVTVTWTRWLWASISIKLKPGVRRKVEAVEIIPSISPIVPTEDVKVIVDCHASME